MLTVEQRHALILSFEATVCTLRAHAGTPAGHPLDVALRRAVEAETVQREFYQVLNNATDWGLHPAAHTPTTGDGA